MSTQIHLHASPRPHFSTFPSDSEPKTHLSCKAPSSLHVAENRTKERGKGKWGNIVQSRDRRRLADSDGRARAAGKNESAGIFTSTRRRGDGGFMASKDDASVVEAALSNQVERAY